MHDGMKVHGTWALAAVLAIAGTPAAASAGFSASTVFALPAHNDIDSRCQDARHFADKAAKSTADIDAPAALDAAQAFMACLHLPSVHSDEDSRRYLYLAATASVYLAATKSQGDDALTLFKRADTMARSLGATAPDKTVRLEHWSVGTLDPGVTKPQNLGKDTTVVSHDPLGSAPPGTYTNVANELVQAIDAQEPTGPAPASSASPPPAPSSPTH
jgi:hypothetical protein